MAKSMQALALVAMVGIATPSAAIDLTGTWTQKKLPPCTSVFPNGDVVKTKGNHSPMAITQAPDGSIAGSVGRSFRGYAFAKGKNPDSGAVGVLDTCEAHTPNEVLVWKIKSAKTFAPNGKGVSGVMKVEALQGGTFGFATCKVTFERTSTTDPMSSGCP